MGIKLNVLVFKKIYINNKIICDIDMGIDFEEDNEYSKINIKFKEAKNWNKK